MAQNIPHQDPQFPVPADQVKRTVLLPVDKTETPSLVTSPSNDLQPTEPLKTPLSAKAKPGSVRRHSGVTGSKRVDWSIPAPWIVRRGSPFAKAGLAAVMQRRR